jgi:hypothetical protein
MKINLLIYEYKLRQSSLTRTDSTEDLRIFLDSEFYFLNHVIYVQFLIVLR